MEPWQVIVALIQGLVEWLPISSEGQAVLFIYNFGDVPPEALISVVVWLHLGTALAVIVRYPRDFIHILTLRDRRLFRLLLIATLATAVTGVP
ncbi:MAG: undecaprenyl-diphosphate phosphatase, partial [Candidatus Thorarchaeota archaeon]